MKYQIIEASEARRYLSSINDADKISDPNCVWIGNGDELDTLFIELLRHKLDSLKNQYPGKRSDAQNSEFEAKACLMVHELVPNEAALVADYRFWIWISVVHFSDLVEWRYASNEKPADFKNYGIGAKGENFLYRLWLRCEISLDETANDRYHLAKRGQVDFWRSHLFRQQYACVPAMTRAMILFQYPDELEGKPKLKISDIRALAPRMKRLRANLMYEFLDDDGCFKLLEREASHIVRT